MENSGIRPTRRHARVRCTMRIDSFEVEGVSSNISVNGLYLRVPKTALQKSFNKKETLLDQCAPGLEVQLRFTLAPEARSVSLAAEVVWMMSDDRDIGGRAVVGFGLRLLNVSPENRECLQKFVDTFRYTILLVAREMDHLELIKEQLDKEYRLIVCQSCAKALDCLQVEDVGVLITYQDTSEISTLDFLKRVADLLPHANLIRIIVSEEAETEQLQQFVNVGKIFYYLRKPFDLSTLLQVVRRAVDAYAMSAENDRLNAELERANRRLQRENAYLRQRATTISNGFENIVGNSRAWRASLEQVERIRHTEATVHIHGETGTGKELIARALHFGGPRANGPFVAQNCGGMTESLLQSTLFGHVRGAFTGADRDRLGLFQEANNGTLFLDEIGELTPATQVALLRVLQEGEITPVGASRPQKVDVRIVSATHKDLREEIRQKRFREDLYFRLLVISVNLPPLRERTEDIPLLAQHFLDLHCERHGKDILGFSSEAMLKLLEYRWPGNVRELENEIERLVILTENGTKIPTELLSSHIREGRGDLHIPGVELNIPMAEITYDQAIQKVQRVLIGRAMQQAGGIVSRAAEILGMDRTRLSKLRQRLDSDPEHSSH